MAVSAGLFRFDYPVAGRGPGGHPIRGAITVAPVQTYTGRSDRPADLPVDATMIDGARGVDRYAQPGEGAIVVGHNDTVDVMFALFFKAKGYGSRLVPVPEPDPRSYCPIDGALRCRRLEWAAQHVHDVLGRDRKAALLGSALIPGEMDEDGTAPRDDQQHVIWVAERLGVDWRQAARVRLQWRLVGYLELWPRPPFPDPKIPVVPPPEAQPSVVTPRFVRRWLDAEVAAGRIVLTAQLPPPNVRKTLREGVGLSLQRAADLAGVTAEAVRLWEAGEREPTGANRDRYLELLGAWSNAPRQASGDAQVPAQASEDPEGGDPIEVTEMLREASEAAQEVGRQLTASDWQRARAAAYKRHREKMQRLSGRS